MAIEKPTLVQDVPVDHENSKRGTADDQADMLRLGKVQELRRNFQFPSMLGFSMILMASWENSISFASIGLVEGGTAGWIWIFFISWMSFMFINVSMAEMGSMAPTTGGQYHWVSEFSPRKYQRFLSYLMGWLCVLGWQTAAAGAAFLAGTQLQGVLVLNYPSYVSEPWHGTLLMIGVGAFSVFFNTVLASNLPLIEGMILIVHVCAYIGILVTLWVLAPRSDVATVFTQFGDNGWNSLGGSTLAGITAGILPLVGADAAVHMSEELQDASRTLPRSMIWSTFLNGALGWVMVITLCICLGDLDDALATPTGYPYMEVFLNATQSTSAATAMVAFVLFMEIACYLTTVATASRQLYAFARDQGVPFGPWLSKVVWDVPINAVLVTFVTTTILSFINLGSATALNNISSLGTVALLSSYICSISCMVWRRATGNPLPRSKFSLGRFGLPINVISVALLVLFFVLAFFPTAPNPDTESMNWAILIYSVVVIFSLVYYTFRGRHRYVGPVEYVRKLE